MLAGRAGCTAGWQAGQAKAGCTPRKEKTVGRWKGGGDRDGSYELISPLEYFYNISSRGWTCWLSVCRPSELAMCWHMSTRALPAVELLVSYVRTRATVRKLLYVPKSGAAAQASDDLREETEGTAEA